MELQKTDSYAKAYVEILEIISHMDEEYRNKIPNKLLDFFEENKDQNYIFNLDNNEGVFSDKTIGILAMLESKYWANLEEKKLLNKTLNENEINYQEKSRKKYNPDDIFKKENVENKIEKNIVPNEVNIVEYKESIFKKFINKIKSIFYIK